MKKLVNIINEKLKNCTICENYNTRGGVYSNSDRKDIDYFFVAQNPGASHYNKNLDPTQIIPFDLSSWTSYNRFFKFLFEDFNLIKGRDPLFYITNIVKCCTKNNRINDTEMISNCVLKFLKREIEYISETNTPIIAMGIPAIKTLNQFNLKNYFTIYHPGYLNRRKNDKIINEAKILNKKILEK